MEEFTEVCSLSDVPDNTMKGFTVGGKDILIANVGGEVHAMDAVCSHMSGYLPRGQLKGHIVKCPVHGAEFDVRTGKLARGLPWVIRKGTRHEVTDLTSYETRVVDTRVWVRL